MSASKLSFSVPIAEFEEFLECPVCYTIPDSSPIYQCENGHILCQSCRPKLENCPTCRHPLRNTRSLLAEKVLEKIPVKCTFSRNGCTLRLEKKNVIAHETVCPFRDVMCFMTNCERYFPIGELVSHIKSNHEDKLCYTKSKDGKDILSYIMSETVKEGFCCYTSTLEMQFFVTSFLQDSPSPCPQRELIPFIL